VLLAPTLHRGRDPHRLAILRHGAARNIDPGVAQLLHDAVVRQNRLRVLGNDQLLDAVANRFAECASPPLAAAMAEVKKY